jgi:two-component system, response regulator YesN
MYTVIIVDDEPIIKKSLTKLIEMKFPQFKVIGYADDGREALSLTKKLRPNLIITDIRMPEMDGLELIHHIETLGLDIKIVVVSGFDEFEYAQHAMRHGAVDYLLKPIKPDMFYKMLEKVESHLKNRTFYTQKTRDWLYKCKEYSEEIITNLLGARNKECEDILSNCYQEMKTQQVDSLLTREFYFDLYKFVKAGINNRLDKNLSYEPFETSSFHYENKAIIEHLKDWFMNITNYIQVTKNWGNTLKVKLALEFINAHFADPNITLQDVADHVNMSAAYFSRQFKEECGKSFIHYLTELRMEEAKKLLVDIRLKTYEIAEMVGYNDYPHFTKTFKKYHKLSPKEYRNLLSS